MRLQHPRSPALRPLDVDSQARRTTPLARSQYQKGVTDFLHVLDVQRQALSARQQEADSRATIATNLVTLYKALGGGWDQKAGPEGNPKG